MTLEIYFECRERSSINYISFAEIITESFFRKKNNKKTLLLIKAYFIKYEYFSVLNQKIKRMQITKANTYNGPDIF